MGLNNVWLHNIKFVIVKLYLIKKGLLHERPENEVHMYTHIYIDIDIHK